MNLRLSHWVLFFLCLGTCQQFLHAQTSNCILDPLTGEERDRFTGGRCIKTIQTAVPFLTITPDARAAALGDAGVALSPTAASADFNASSLAFSDKRFEIQGTYTPWLAALNLDDVYLANLQLYGKLDELQTIYGSIRYFSLGQIDFTDFGGNLLLTGKPYEMAVNVGYARQLSEHWSGSLGGQFILSSLARGLQIDGTDNLATNGTAGAASIGTTYQNTLAIGQGADLQVGASIRNLGSKITYSKSVQKDYLPANLGIGASLRTYFDDYNSLTYVIEMNKLLVPSPQRDSTDADGNGRADWLDDGPIQAAFKSFADADGGAGEELREINWSGGLEYWYADQFAARAGYFFEPNSKGGRQYLTLGVGLKYNVLGLDFSYLVPTTSLRSPLENTLRLSLTYSFIEDTATAN